STGAGADESESTVDVWRDAGAKLSFDAVRARAEVEWTRWDGRGYVRSFSGEAVWVRIVLRNGSDQPQRGVLADAEYYTDRIDLWMRASDANPEENERVAETWIHQRAGEWVPVAEKALWGRDAAFFVEVPAHGEREVFLR